MNDREADTKAYDDYRRRVGEVAGLDIWRAALAHARQQSGDYVMVPREPTQEWFDRVANALHVSDADIKGMHDAFIDAAALAPQQSAEPVAWMSKSEFAEAFEKATATPADDEAVRLLREAREEVNYMASGMTHAAWKTKQAQEMLAKIDAYLARVKK